MSTTRQNKYARLIQKDIGDIFQREHAGSFNNAFITVTDVEVSPDLSIASIYISVLANEDKQGIIDLITASKSKIRKSLGNRIGKQARIVPDLRFFLDNTEDQAARMDDIINKLNIPPAEEALD